MKTILCFGDSLTFGEDPATGLRHAYEDRWPSALEAGLGGNARIIPEGLGGRTTAYEDGSSSIERNGARILPVFLASHAPLDLVVIMLGSNDLRAALHGRPAAAGQGIRRLIRIVRGHHAEDPRYPLPKVLVMSPPHVVESDEPMIGENFAGAIESSKQLARHYRHWADLEGAHFFDAAEAAVASPIDGVHLDAANTRAIGEALVPVVTSILEL